MPTLIEKTVLVESKVDDLWGLLMDLRRADFKVRNVGADSRGTYVHLEVDEEKDPAPIVEAWVGKEPAKSSALVREIRLKELKKVQEQEAVRQQERQEKERQIEEARQKAAEQGGAVVAAAEIAPAPSRTDAQETNFLKKLFRRFF